MVNLCTISDGNFLIKGLSLYESLLSTSSNFTLHYLLTDDSYESVKKYENEKLKFYSNKDVCENDVTLNELKETKYDYFCWSLSSYFSKWLLDKNIYESITYIDSDILFYQDIKLVHDTIGDKDIGLFRHRMFPLGIYRPEGLFNVGVVYFKNSKIGKEALNWWADAVVNQKYPGMSSCGDQKYLEFFMYAYPDKVQIDGDIAHGAPWHWQLYNLGDFYSNGHIQWENKKQLMVFSHFSQFKTDFKQDTYIASTNHHCYTPLGEYENNLILKGIHQDYFETLKETKSKYKL